MLATQTCNLRAVAPSYSVFSRPLAAGQKQQCEQAVEEALAALERGAATVEQGRSLEQGLALDPGVALLHFAHARWLEAKGEREAAREAFQRALDLDEYPNRATGPFNATLREAAATGGAVLVDLEEEFFRICAGAAPGSELFLDHCHPTIESTCAMAESFWRALLTWLRARGLASASEPESLLLGEAVEDWLAALTLDRTFLSSRIVGAAKLNLLRALQDVDRGPALDLARAALRQALAVDPGSQEALAAECAAEILAGDPDNAWARLGAAAGPVIVRLDAWMAAVPALRDEAARLGIVIEAGRARRSRGSP